MATSLTISLYRRIREEILNGRLRPGQMVSERELVERLGASRTPIRHALARLQEQGLLTPQARRGYVVSTVSLRDVAEILYLRMVLEGAAAELAARFVGEAELAEMARLAEVSYRPGDPASYARFVRANREFHLKVARASRNMRLANAIARLLDEMQRVIEMTVALSYRVEEMQRDHRALVDALRRHDPAQARQVAVRAMEASQQRIAQALWMPNETPGTVSDGHAAPRRKGLRRDRRSAGGQ
ncbi:MAG: GntR family transcriptional regulator [Armatimonadetes bacterium]|nr:GntR family transcriptional regulator [Armatimonadota bacterium]